MIVTAHPHKYCHRYGGRSLFSNQITVRAYRSLFSQPDHCQGLQESFLPIRSLSGLTGVCSPTRSLSGLTGVYSPNQITVRAYKSLFSQPDHGSVRTYRRVLPEQLSIIIIPSTTLTRAWMLGFAAGYRPRGVCYLVNWEKDALLK